MKLINILLPNGDTMANHIDIVRSINQDFNDEGKRIRHLEILVKLLKPRNIFYELPKDIQTNILRFKYELETEDLENMLDIKVINYTYASSNDRGTFKSYRYNIRITYTPTGKSSYQEFWGHEKPSAKILAKHIKDKCSVFIRFFWNSCEDRLMTEKETRSNTEEAEKFVKETSYRFWHYDRLAFTMRRSQVEVQEIMEMMGRTAFDIMITNYKPK